MFSDLLRVRHSSCLPITSAGKSQQICCVQRKVGCRSLCRLSGCGCGKLLHSGSVLFRIPVNLNLPLKRQHFRSAAFQLYMLSGERQGKNGREVKSVHKYFSFHKWGQKDQLGFYLTSIELQLKIQDFVLHTMVGLCSTI